MSRRPLGSAGVAGIAAAGIVAAVVILPLIAVAWTGWGRPTLSPADLAALEFTLLQAALSAAFSCLLAIPLARALSRRRFPGRGALVSLLGAPFILPVIVAVFGLVAVFGRAGPVNAMLAAAGLPPLSIYGLSGVVLAHVFFNLPLVTRLLLQGWQDVPAEQFRLAAMLGLGSRAQLRLIERPMLRKVLPGAALLVFVLCTTSFAVAITLGGGPRATTIELAIYQALRFDFEPARAAVLSVVQLAVTGGAALVALRVARAPEASAGLGRPPRRWDGRQTAARAGDATVIALACLFLGAPLTAVLLDGLPRIAALPLPVLEAALRSVAVALAATGLAVTAALFMAVAAWRLGSAGDRVESVALLSIAASPLVLGTGLFVIVWPVFDPARAALAVTALLNAVAALPFALRSLRPAHAEIETRHGRLADALALTRARRLSRITLPLMARPLGFVAGLTAALSMGDLGVIALFADPDSTTLPLEVFRLMGAYRTQDAAAAALLLALLSFALFLVFDLAGRRVGRVADAAP